MCSRNSGSISSTLLESAKARRPEAWRRLVDLYGQVVYGWCRKSGLGAEDAADAVQEVFSAVSRHLGDFRREKSGDSFTGWLSTITRSKVCDHFRRTAAAVQAEGGTKAHRRMQGVAQPEQRSAEAEPEGDSPFFRSAKNATVPADFDLHEAERILSRRAAELVRAEFEPKTWQAWWNTAVEGRQTADVAAELGMTPAAVYKAKSRVLLRLRQELAGLNE